MFSLWILLNYDDFETISTNFRRKYVIFVEFRRFFTEETNSVHRFLSVFPFSWLLVNLRAYEAFVLPSCFAEEHPLDIRIYYLVWHLHLLHCWDIVKSFNATSKNVFRSIGRSFRCISRSFRSSRRSFRSSCRSFRSVFYVFSSLMQVSIRSGLLFSLTVGMLQPLSRIQQVSAKFRNAFVKVPLCCWKIIIFLQISLFLVNNIEMHLENLEI